MTITMTAPRHEQTASYATTKLMTLAPTPGSGQGQQPVLTTRPHNLLIIDDEADIVKALRRQFRPYYNIYMATSAAEGYQIMTEVAIHVIISDQRMPGMSGVEFFDRVKHEFPDAIRLLLTGYADIQSVIAAINDGNVFRYIAKPWDPAELDSIVREAFNKHDLILENRDLLQQLQAANHFLEQRVTERTAQLRFANEQKDRFMGMVAHDLRGPIGTIQMCAETLRLAEPGQAEQAEFLGMIEETAGHSLALINDLLDIATIESGNLVIERQTIDLVHFLGRISRRYLLVSERKGIRLAVKFDPTLDPVSANIRLDPRRIEQLLDNLLSNALKYSYSGTTVTVQLWCEASDLLISVADQGQGIAPHELDSLFKTFSRTSTRPTGNEQSTGLGLAICKRIVELHQGTINVTSVVGQGTTFTVRLGQAVAIH